MPIIQNTAPGQFDLVSTPTGGRQATASVPPCKTNDAGVPVNGSVEVSDEDLDALCAHPFTEGLFRAGVLLFGPSPAAALEPLPGGTPVDPATIPEQPSATPAVAAAEFSPPAAEAQLSAPADAPLVEPAPAPAAEVAPVESAPAEPLAPADAPASSPPTVTFSPKGKAKK